MMTSSPGAREPGNDQQQAGSAHRQEKLPPRTVGPSSGQQSRKQTGKPVNRGEPLVHQNSTTAGSQDEMMKAAGAEKTLLLIIIIINNSFSCRGRIILGGGGGGGWKLA